MWDLIVSVPDHCSSFYFVTHIRAIVTIRCLLRNTYTEVYIRMGLVSCLLVADRI